MYIHRERIPRFFRSFRSICLGSAHLTRVGPTFGLRKGCPNPRNTWAEWFFREKKWGWTVIDHLRVQIIFMMLAIFSNNVFYWGFLLSFSNLVFPGPLDNYSIVMFLCFSMFLKCFHICPQNLWKTIFVMCGFLSLFATLKVSKDQMVRWMLGVNRSGCGQNGQQELSKLCLR
jgi:hypothetical protein